MTGPPETETPPAATEGASEVEAQNERHDTAEPVAVNPRARSNSTKGEGTWCWCAKSALDRIASGKAGNVTHAIAVYLALCWLGSDRESGTFDAWISEIRTRSGLSRRSVNYAIESLLAAELISVKYNRDGKRNLRNTFTILTLKASNPRTARSAGGSAQDAGGVVHDVQEGTAREGGLPVQTSEEQEEGVASSDSTSSRKKKWKNSARPPSRSRSRPLGAARRGDGGAAEAGHPGNANTMDEQQLAWLAKYQGGGK